MLAQNKECCLDTPEQGCTCLQLAAIEAGIAASGGRRDGDVIQQRLEFGGRARAALPLGPPRAVPLPPPSPSGPAPLAPAAGPARQAHVAPLLLDL